MTIDQLDPKMTYSVIRYLPDREVDFVTGAEAMDEWETSAKVQRFSMAASIQRPPTYVQCVCSMDTYILVRPAPGVSPSTWQTKHPKHV